MALSVWKCLRSTLVLDKQSCVVVVILTLLSPSALFCQNQPPQSDPQAVSLAAQSIAALTSGNSLSDVTLTGTATWSGGTAPESGNITLLALGSGESRMDLSLPSGTRSEIRDASTGIPQGEWVGLNGSGLFAPQNCATDAVWFFPALSSLTIGQNVVLTYIGLESRNGTSVQHLQSYIYQPPSPKPQPGPTYQQLSTVDFYLDATTLLPVASVFNVHPDDSTSTNLSVEVDFLNYQTMNGFVVPMHIQKLLQGNVLVDAVISGASFNTGLPLSDFAIN